MDISRGQGRILGVLLIEDSISTKDLSQRTGIKISSLNEILSKLEKKELIQRKPSKEDKRIIINCLTEKARLHQPKLDISFFNCLNEKQKKEFNFLLSQLCDQLEANICDLSNEELINNCLHRKNYYELFLNYQNNAQEENAIGGKLC